MAIFVIFNKNLTNSSNGDVGILSKTTSFRKNSWELNHSRVSGPWSPNSESTFVCKVVVSVLSRVSDQPPIGEQL